MQWTRTNEKGEKEVACIKCQKLKPIHKFCDDDDLKLPICGKCYANDYKDDIEEITALYQDIYNYKDLTEEQINELAEILSDEDLKQVRKVFEIAQLMKQENH
jgi:hypothetical protein